MAEGRKRRGWSIFHLLFCMSLSLGWLAFCANHTPAWQILRGHRGVKMFAALKVAWPYIWPDLAASSAVLLMFSLGTGTYVRRFAGYLAMAGSGQVAAVRGIGIQGQTLESNVGRRGGIE